MDSITASGPTASSSTALIDPFRRGSEYRQRRFALPPPSDSFSTDEAETLDGEFVEDFLDEADGEPEPYFLDCVEDGPRAVIDRPCRLINGLAYIATWYWKEGATEPTLYVVNNWKQTYSLAGGNGTESLSVLGIQTDLPVPQDTTRYLSREGLRGYLDGATPSYRELFQSLVDTFDQFIDFTDSLGPQRDMAELLSCYVISTYLLDGFQVAGYLWLTGVHGSGKTNVQILLSELCCLGSLVDSTTTTPSIRDLAALGCTIVIDDCDDLLVKRGDRQRRALLLSGTHKGAKAVRQVRASNGNWLPKDTNTYGARVFSAINHPDPVMASRNIMIPLIPSSDPCRAKAEPKEFSTWKHDRRQLVDDLWVLSLENLARAPVWEREAKARALLMGRPLEPWQNLLAVGLWLESEHRVLGLFERLTRLSLGYQQERREFEADTPMVLTLRALLQLVGEGDNTVRIIETSAISDQVNRLAVEEGWARPGAEYVNHRSTGRLLSKLRFASASTRSRRRRSIVPEKVRRLARAYGVTS